MIHPALLLAVALLGTSLVLSPRADPATAPGVWAWPLESGRQVVAEFRAPATRYGAGHRGLDLAAARGEPVLAPADGVVAFAGTVVDRPLLSIDHAPLDGTETLRSTLEPVQPLVAEGDLVARGQPIGTVATGGHCSTHCLHLGARLRGTYINPRLLLATVPRAILLPLAAPLHPARSDVVRPGRVRTSQTPSPRRIALRRSRTASRPSRGARSDPRRRMTRSPPDGPNGPTARPGWWAVRRSGAGQTARQPDAG